MSEAKLVVVTDVARRLQGVEALIDQTVSAIADFTAILPRARIDAQLPALVGQGALDQAGEALSHLIAARRAAVAVHKQLDRTREILGIPTIAFGDESEKPPFVNPNGVNLTPEGEVIRLPVAA